MDLQDAHPHLLIIRLYRKQKRTMFFLFFVFSLTSKSVKQGDSLFVAVDEGSRILNPGALGFPTLSWVGSNNLCN